MCHSPSGSQEDPSWDEGAGGCTRLCRVSVPCDGASRVGTSKGSPFKTRGRLIVQGTWTWGLVTRWEVWETMQFKDISGLPWWGHLLSDGRLDTQVTRWMNTVSLIRGRSSLPLFAALSLGCQSLCQRGPKSHLHTPW